MTCDNPYLAKATASPSSIESDFVTAHLSWTLIICKWQDYLSTAEHYEHYARQTNNEHFILTTTLSTWLD